MRRYTVSGVGVETFSMVSSLMRTMLRRIDDEENFPRELRLLIVIVSRPYSY